MIDLQTGQTNLFDLFLLQQIIRASRALEAGSENEHPHFSDISMCKKEQRRHRKAKDVGCLVAAEHASGPVQCAL
jgi:hypothetical protein